MRRWRSWTNGIEGGGFKGRSGDLALTLMSEVYVVTWIQAVHFLRPLLVRLVLDIKKKKKGQKLLHILFVHKSHWESKAFYHQFKPQRIHQGRNTVFSSPHPCCELSQPHAWRPSGCIFRADFADWIYSSEVILTFSDGRSLDSSARLSGKKKTDVSEELGWRVLNYCVSSPHISVWQTGTAVRTSQLPAGASTPKAPRLSPCKIKTHHTVRKIWTLTRTINTKNPILLLPLCRGMSDVGQNQPLRNSSADAQEVWFHTFNRHTLRYLWEIVP